MSSRESVPAGTIYLGLDVHEDSVAIAVLPSDAIAPSLIPTKPGQQRKHDQYDAAQLARLYRAGELTVIGIPSAARVRVSRGDALASAPLRVAAAPRPRDLRSGSR